MPGTRWCWLLAGNCCGPHGNYTLNAKDGTVLRLVTKVAIAIRKSISGWYPYSDGLHRQGTPLRRKHLDCDDGCRGQIGKRHANPHERARTLLVTRPAIARFSQANRNALPLPGGQARPVDDIYLPTDGENPKQVARKNGLKVIDCPPEFVVFTMLMTNASTMPSASSKQRMPRNAGGVDVQRGHPARRQDRHLPSGAAGRSGARHGRDRARMGRPPPHPRQDLERRWPAGAHRADAGARDHDAPTARHDVPTSITRSGFRASAITCPAPAPAVVVYGDAGQGIVNDDIVIDIHTPADIAYTEQWLQARAGDQPG